MLHKFYKLVPANTTSASPTWDKLKLTKGTIISWIIFMPVECADLVQFKVSYQNTQILPYTDAEWMYGFFEPTVIKGDLSLVSQPLELDINCINTDDTYDHEINLYVNLLPAEQIELGEKAPAGFWEALRNLLGGE